MTFPIATILLPADTRFVAAAASAAFDALAECWPDASAAVIVLPALRAVPDFKRALGATAAQRGYPSVLPPRITTLDAWQESVPLAAQVQPGVARSAALQQILKARGWFGGAPPWETCAAILELADELSGALPAPPPEADFIDMIGRHYRAAAARVAAPEAKLVLEVWRAFASMQGKQSASGHAAALDPGLARRMRLEALAATINGPLIWVATRPNGAAFGAPIGAVLDQERQFVESCAARVQVTLVAPRALPDWLAAGWAEPGSATLAERAQTLSEVGALVAGAFSLESLELIAAHSLEDEAAAVAARVNAWLAAGHASIALIALDRLTARRARALLERDQILLTDESGWKLSTTSAATCAMRWVDAVMSGFHQRDLIDWLKSPFAFADVAAAERKAAVALIERAIGRSNVLAGLGAVRRAVQELPPDDAVATTALALLTRIETAARPWQRRSAPLSEWFALLGDSLRDLGAYQALARDLAGAGVLALIDNLREQLDEQKSQEKKSQEQKSVASTTAASTTAEWRTCFAAELEAAVFRDSEIDSPVVLTSLAAVRLRHFDAVLLIGADAVHLGAAAEDALFLSTRLRAELKLATPELRQAQLRDDLGMLIAMSGSVSVTWQATQRGEVNPLAPWFERLDALSIAAGRGSLIRATPARVARRVAVPGQADAALGAELKAARHHAPAPRAAVLTPASVSVSAYASLIACPYQFFARHLLRLNEPDEVREEFEKRDYGEWVHRLLNRFHQRFPRISGVPRADLKAALTEIIDAVFAPAIEFNFLSTGWKLRSVELIDAYLDWQQQREDAGWLWQEGEVKAAIDIALDAEASIKLIGRLDRIDTRRDGAIEILDYKTQSRAALQQKLAEAGEDVQLAAYRLLKMEAGVAEAAFVSLDAARVETVPENNAHLPEDEWQRISTLFGAMHSGAPLPANGVETVCAYCEMRGLCRRDYWAQAGRDDGGGA